MNTFESLLARNKHFAAQQSAAGKPTASLPEATPHVKALIISCADMRVDPAHILGLELGEALVLRNIGGRITPGLMEEMGLLGKISQVMGKPAAGGGEFHVIVLQHTDCGITRLAGDPALLAHFFQVQESEFDTKTVTYPRRAVATDVATLRAMRALPASWLLSGLVFDVATGLVEVVVPPAPLRAA